MIDYALQGNNYTGVYFAELPEPPEPFPESLPRKVELTPVVNVGDSIGGATVNLLDLFQDSLTAGHVAVGRSVALFVCLDNSDVYGVALAVRT